MSDILTIQAVARNDGGKGASRRLRREGLVPGIIYGGGQDPEMVATAHNKLLQLLEHEACLLYTSPSPRDSTSSRMPSSA